ncbi:MAG TPA: hypothetical protein DCQ98_05415 [Planctomycetaceae bacterium]|nr:hypothetical protein [Planctomycetaceae bacterium]
MQIQARSRVRIGEPAATRAANGASRPWETKKAGVPQGNAGLDRWLQEVEARADESARRNGDQPQQVGGQATTSPQQRARPAQRSRPWQRASRIFFRMPTRPQQSFFGPKQSAGAGSQHGAGAGSQQGAASPQHETCSPQHLRARRRARMPTRPPQSSPEQATTPEQPPQP